MKTLVLSGINLYTGGPLTIYKDVLSTLISNNYLKKYHIIAFVHKKDLFVEFKHTKIHFIEIPQARSSYVLRLYYEYIWFYRYSKKATIDIWISLHDITPNVKTDKLYTYCHNPTPFLKRSHAIKKYDKVIYYMSQYYTFLYRINIHKNTAVIVQQDWIRKKFKEMYHIDNIIVSKPIKGNSYQIITQNKLNNGRIVFIFPALARPFKNHQVICEAVRNLEANKLDFEVWLTIDGNENKYAEDLYSQYGELKNIKWIGIHTQEQMKDLYARSDCLIFPSLLETWGLPISEYKVTGKEIILIDLPYAHETIGSYDKVMFFEAGSVDGLVTKMEAVINKIPIYEPQKEKKILEPYASSWEELLKYILGENDEKHGNSCSCDIIQSNQ